MSSEAGVGYLLYYRLQDNEKVWSRRYFVVDSGVLKYGRTAAKLNRHCRIAGGSVKVDQRRATKFQFKVSSPEVGSMYLRASSQEELDGWISALTKATEYDGAIPDSEIVTVDRSGSERRSSKRSRGSSSAKKEAAAVKIQAMFRGHQVRKSRPMKPAPDYQTEDEGNDKMANESFTDYTQSSDNGSNSSDSD